MDGKGLRIPASTYRLQFNSQFRCNDAREIAPYLQRLGISDIYASPCFKASAGSLRDYDILYQNSLNPAISTSIFNFIRDVLTLRFSECMVKSVYGLFITPAA